MDISRLPTAPVVQPVSVPKQNVQRPGPAAVPRDVESADARPRVRASSGDTIQGELLSRNRSRYQSTRSFLDERALGNARPVETASVSQGPPRAALSSYLQHIRAEPLAEVTRGQAVNLLV